MCQDFRCDRNARVRIDYDDHPDQCDAVTIVETDVWTVAEAKAKLSEVIEQAKSQGPQTITRNGRRAAVVVDADEWERRNERQGNLAEFFASSPLRGSKLKVRRSKGRLRPTGL
jgi:prevent-host-death family protein